MNNNDISDIIAKANPMPVDNGHDTNRLTPAETKLCEAIMSLPTLIPSNETIPTESGDIVDRRQDQPETNRSSNGRRDHRRHWTLIGAGSVAAALAALVLVTLPSNEKSNIALAEWTATPQIVSADEQAAIETACAETQPEFADPATSGVLIDRRGAIAAVAATNADIRLTCAARLVDGTWMSFATTAGSGGDLSQPALMRASNSDGAEINIVNGFVADAVTVEVDAPAVPTSTATVVDGRYIVWLPQSFDWTDDLAGIEVRYLDGAGQTFQTIRF